MFVSSAKIVQINKLCNLWLYSISLHKISWKRVNLSVSFVAHSVAEGRQYGIHREHYPPSSCFYHFEMDVNGVKLY